MRRETKRYTMAFLILAALLVTFLVWNLNAGSYGISVSQVMQIFLGNGSDATASRVVWDIRLPRVLAAILLGGALSVAGFLLQTFFANPIAGPFVLGISSGAKLVVAMTMILFLQRGLLSNSVVMIAAAFVGAMLSMAFVLLVARKVRSMSILIICGIMIGYICSALTDFAVTFADDANIVNLHNWSRGSFSGMTWDNVKVMSIVVAVTLLMVILLAKPLEAYQLGETYAQNLGVNIRTLRILLVVLSSVLSACIVAFAGPISFVGIAVPQLIRKLFGTTKPLLMIPACFLGGSVFCLFCDLLARTWMAPTELGISTVTAIFGAPVVLWIMVSKSRRERG